jgi:hypothetical protein
MIDRSHPNPAARVPHVFADIDGDGTCVCGQPRFVGSHIAETEEREQLHQMTADCLGAITGEVLALQTILQRLGVLEVPR